MRKTAKHGTDNLKPTMPDIRLIIIYIIFLIIIAHQIKFFSLVYKSVSRGKNIVTGKRVQKILM